jgi:TonB family protein
MDKSNIKFIMLIQKFKQTGSYISLAVILVISSCNNDSTSDNTEATVSTEAKTDSPTTVKVKRTGKVSASMDKTEPSKIYKKGPDGVYESVQVQPEYPGGETALSNYISNTLVYPEMAIDENAEGTVRVQFIVNENGTVSNPTVVGPQVGHGLDEAAINAFSKMDNWTPGKVNGKNVKTRLVLPVVYRIE